MSKNKRVKKGNQVLRNALLVGAFLGPIVSEFFQLNNLKLITKHAKEYIEWPYNLSALCKTSMLLNSAPDPISYKESPTITRMFRLVTSINFYRIADLFLATCSAVLLGCIAAPIIILGIITCEIIIPTTLEVISAIFFHPFVKKHSLLMDINNEIAKIYALGNNASAEKQEQLKRLSYTDSLSPNYDSAYLSKQITAIKVDNKVSSAVLFRVLKNTITSFVPYIFGFYFTIYVRPSLEANSSINWLTVASNAILYFGSFYAHCAAEVHQQIKQEKINLLLEESFQLNPAQTAAGYYGSMKNYFFVQNLNQIEIKQLECKIVKRSVEIFLHDESLLPYNDCVIQAVQKIKAEPRKTISLPGKLRVALKENVYSGFCVDTEDSEELTGSSYEDAVFDDIQASLLSKVASAEIMAVTEENIDPTVEITTALSNRTEVITSNDEANKIAAEIMVVMEVNIYPPVEITAVLDNRTEAITSNDETNQIADSKILSPQQLNRLIPMFVTLDSHRRSLITARRGSAITEKHSRTSEDIGSLSAANTNGPPYLTQPSLQRSFSEDDPRSIAKDYVVPKNTPETCKMTIPHDDIDYGMWANKNTLRRQSITCH